MGSPFNHLFDMRELKKTAWLRCWVVKSQTEEVFSEFKKRIGHCIHNLKRSNRRAYDTEVDLERQNPSCQTLYDGYMTFNHNRYGDGYPGAKVWWYSSCVLETLFVHKHLSEIVLVSRRRNQSFACAKGHSIDAPTNTCSTPQFTSFTQFERLSPICRHSERRQLFPKTKSQPKMRSSTNIPQEENWSTESSQACQPLRQSRTEYPVSWECRLRNLTLDLMSLHHGMLDILMTTSVSPNHAAIVKVSRLDVGISSFATVARTVANDLGALSSSPNQESHPLSNLSSAKKIFSVVEYIVLRHRRYLPQFTASGTAIYNRDRTYLNEI
ncbi:hypothetical protein DFS34DRAFT_592872 [Phlyctochytrium arcticum]|nr:hypothetical protein DFS34DRAFT_592872 [Phlyctochytrium arcticum]